MRTYTQEEAMSASAEFFGGDDLAAGVFVTKYALRDGEGNLLESTPDQMHTRLAREFARIEENYPNPLSAPVIEAEFRERDEHLDRDVFGRIVPQGSPMAGIGNDHRVMSISNCFVIDSPVDSYGGIMLTDQQQAQIMKRRGGVGFDISPLRPKHALVRNAAQTSDGIGVFMERFSNTTREVAQNGRRGALMISISCHHPEVETFIEIKRDRTKVTGANVSVRCSDEFMEAVRDGTTYVQRFPVEPGLPREEYQVWREVDARSVWRKMMGAAWESAEPGVLFWDSVMSTTPSECYADLGFAATSVNPCGEIILCPGDSCRLMVVNLSRFIRQAFTADAWFDWEAYEASAYRAQRLMDDMVDLELEKVKSILAKIDTDPEPDHVKHIERELWQKIYRMGEQGRRTGLGITALGDVIAAMGMRYGSVESIAFTDEAYRHLAIGAYKSSIDMAEERGAFPLWDYEREKDHSFIKRIIAQLPTEYQQRYKEHGRRNIACTTTAPTGSVSVLTQTTSGIEPAFMTSYTRRRKINPSEEGQLSVDFVDDLGDKWHEYIVYHHWYKRWIDITGGRIFSADPYDKSMANDVDWEASVDIQAAAQKWICHSISKTCNLPKDVDVDLVDRVYMKAWETGCKGFTVYRDGSRTGVLVTENEQAKERGEDFIDVRNAPKRPDELDCDIHHAQIRGEKWTIIVGLMNGRPYEILGGLTEKIELPRKYKVGRVKKRPRKTRNSIYDLYAGEGDDQFVIKDLVDTFHNPNHTAFTRTISLSLRHGVPTNYLVEQLQKDRDADLFSFSKVIARVLKKYIEDGTKAGNMLIEGCSKPGECSLTYVEGCISCTTCGMSRCG